MLEFMQQLKSRIRKLRDLAYTHLEEKQRKQKTLYDKGKRWRTLTTNDWALVLLPSMTTKFLSEWRGPYKVIQVLGKTTYQLQMTPGRTQTFHINLLKKWIGPPPASAHLAFSSKTEEASI